MSDDRETWYRVPRSAEECAVHLEAGGVVEINDDGRWRQTTAGARSFREATPEGFGQDEYRLVYSSPVGMSPVIGAPGHAYGLARQAPEEWYGRHGGEAGWVDGHLWHLNIIIEARPPVPAPEPRTEKVPWYDAVTEGMKVVHSTGYIVAVWVKRNPDGFMWLEGVNSDPRVPVGADGLVEVLAEEEA